VIVFLWQTATAEGVTNDLVKAVDRAASFMGSSVDSTAVLVQARFVGGNNSLSSCYKAVPGCRWMARRLPDGRVSWEQLGRTCTSSGVTQSARAKSRDISQGVVRR